MASVPPRPTNLGNLPRLLAYAQGPGLERHLYRAKRAVPALAPALVWLMLAWRGTGQSHRLEVLDAPLLAALQDADQLPEPEILDRTLGYFADPDVAFVQTPQHFYNVPEHDPFGSQAPLFYGPIMQGKDGWNAAFFCGSNAVLRREALMQLGITDYVRELEERVPRALAADVTHSGTVSGSRGAAPLERDVLGRWPQPTVRPGLRGGRS